MALCPARHVVCEDLSGRDQKPLCVGCLKCLLTFPLLLHATVGFGLFKPKLGSVFHHDGLSCKITDEQGLSKQATGNSNVDLSCESGIWK